MRKKYYLFKNTFILAVVTFFLRAAGVSFHAYLAKRIGASGMGLFSLVMSVYHFGVTFACSGVGLATTRLVSESLAAGKTHAVGKTVRWSLLHGLIFGGLGTIVLYFGSPFIGKFLLDDARLVPCLRILSVSLPCVAMSSALNGYFSAVGRVGKGAFVQVAEQFIRIGGCVMLFSFINASQAQNACVVVVASGSAAEVISFLLLYALYRWDKRQYGKEKKRIPVLKKLLGISMPVAVSSYLRSGLSTAEHAYIPRGLREYGGDNERALASYGVVHGMVLPLVLFPSAILQAFSTMLLPEIAGYRENGNKVQISSLAESAFRFTMTFSIGTAGILFFFAEEIGMAIYKSQEAVFFIRVLAPLVIAMYTDGVVDAILKGLNQQVYSMAFNIADSALAVILMFFLLPGYGIDGYVAMIYITELFNAFLSLARLLTVSEVKLHLCRNLCLPLLTIIFCSILAQQIVTGIFSAFFAAGFYLFFMTLLRENHLLQNVATCVTIKRNKGGGFLGKKMDRGTSGGNCIP